MGLYHSLQCPFENCKYYNILIVAPISYLIHHIYFDHSFLEKKNLALKLGIIRDIDEPSAKWLSKQLAKRGIQ